MNFNIKNLIYIKYIFLISFSPLLQLSLNSEPCFPNDPNGINSDSLCLNNFILHQVKPNTIMRTGTVTEGYTGAAISPILPGTKLNINKGKDGFITEISNVNGKQIIKSSTGRIWETSN
tara:strand:- start:128 stop:484 length:357 start_codon:yes stop_codon:yes gene_type:complete